MNTIVLYPSANTETHQACDKKVFFCRDNIFEDVSQSVREEALHDQTGYRQVPETWLQQQQEEQVAT